MDDDDYNALFDDVAQNFVQDAPVRLEDDENEGGLRSVAGLRRSNNADAAFESDLRRRRLLQETENDALDWHMRVDCSMDEAAAKRRKIEADEQCLARLLQRISEARSRRIGELSSSDAVDVDDEPIAVGGDHAAAKTKLLRFPPTDGSAWIPVSSTGSRQRFYLITRADADVRWDLVGRSEAKQSRQSRRNRLTGRNFNDLLQEATELMERAKTGAVVESSDSLMTEEPDLNNNTSELWVEKYKPKLFTDLLSDDGINRMLLTWLKMWDECVFKRKIVKPPDHSKNQPDKTAGKNKSKQSSKFEAANELSYELDQYKRPQYKVALLCGPPGLGKTTLAHVIARHVGYNAVEMNASDDRTLERFENCIEGAVQAARTLDAEPRPNCLIIDEIDGAPAPSINYLVSIVRGTAVKHKRKTILRRPIIAICNDLYAPALRELRKVALILQFPTTSPLRLAERLAVVSNWEHLQVDKQALEFLCDKSNQDIRCCLNALQFAAGFDTPTSSTKSNRIGLLDVQKISMGEKDSQKSLLEVWRAVFEIPRSTSRKRSLAEGEPTLSLSARCGRVAQIARAAGDDEKIRMGIFENYLHAKSVDGRIDSNFYGMEWFVYVDELLTLVARTQSYEVMRYTSGLPIAFHILFASSHHVNISFPQAYMQMKQKGQRHRDTLASVMDGGTPGEDGGVVSSAGPKLRATLDVTALNLDTLPFVTVIIQPTLRPVNSQLYSARELAVLKQVVDAMLNFALTYRQQRNTDGNYEYVLEPPIEDLTTYPLETPVGRNTLAYSARQMIAREVELERMRRSESASKALETSAPDSNSTALKNPLPSLQQRTAPRANAFEQSTLSTMFGHRQKEPTAFISTAAIWFRFNEGYSNAIRRHIRMRDLIT